MIIRECLASDAEGVERLFREFVEYLHSIGDETDYHFGAGQYLADGFGAGPAFRGFVAEDSGDLIGYLLFCRTYDGYYLRNLHIIDLYVRQASRGQGAGRMLMDAVRKTAQSEGIRRLSWVVHKNNSGAIRFYERLGAQYSENLHHMRLDV